MKLTKRSLLNTKSKLTCNILRNTSYIYIAILWPFLKSKAKVNIKNDPKVSQSKFSNVSLVKKTLFLSHPDFSLGAICFWYLYLSLAQINFWNFLWQGCSAQIFTYWINFSYNFILRAKSIWKYLKTSPESNKTK